MDYRQVRLELDKGNLRPLYLFSGEEDYLKEELVRDMLKHMHRQGLDPDLLRIDGKKMTWAEVRRELGQVTIFSRGRVLLVNDAPYFASQSIKSSADKAKQDSPSDRSGKKGATLQAEELAPIFSTGFTDTLIIFLASGVDRRRRINRYLEKAGGLVEFPPLKGAALGRWIRDELARDARLIDDDALTELIQRSGEDLFLLKRELEKMVNYLGTEQTIDRPLVEKLVSENIQGNIFHLVDGLGSKNVTAALHHFTALSRRNEPPLRILAMIARHFRLLYRTKLLKQEGLPANKMAATLQVPPFVTGKLLRQLPNFPGNALPYIIADLKEVDLSIKTGRLPAEDALEQFIYQFIL